MSDLERLNAEAWRRRVPFIVDGYGNSLRTVDPERFRQEMIQIGITRCLLEAMYGQIKESSHG
jgi:hypothetical protein